MLLNVFAVLSIGFMARALGEGTFNPSATATSTAPGATHTVSVGADGFNFSPNQVFASVGDIIEYRFYPQNHSVARAAFGSNPCIPYELTGPGRVGFWSGFEPVALVLNNPPIFRLPVNDTDPVFFYCSAPGACLEGMVGVINPNSTFSYQAQFNYTQNATVQFSPGEYFPKEEGPTSRTTTATGATATPTVQTASTTGPAATTTAAAPVTEHSKSSGLPTGAIVGIAIGAFAVVVLAGALIYMCGRQKTVKELLRHSQPPPAHQAYPASPGMSEAQYSNMQKTPMMGTHYSGQSYGGPPTDHESYRTASPPPAGEHQPMMGGMHPMHLNLHNQSGPPSAAGSPGFPSPTYSQEMEHAAAVRHYNPEENPSNHLNPTVNQTQHQDSGPHELAVPGPPSRNTSTAVGPPTPQNPDNRPFSYTDSESGYAKVATPIEKSGTLR